MSHIALRDYQAQAQYIKFEQWHIGCFSPVPLLIDSSHDKPVVIDKPVVLFLHGFPSASYDWHYQWQALRHSHLCIGLDFLGFGISDKPYPHQYTLQQQTDAVCVLLEHMKAIGIEACHVVAHDYGVSVAQELVARSQSRTSVNEQLPDLDVALPVELQSVIFLNGGLFAALHKPLFTQKLLKSSLGPIVAKLMSKRTLHQSFMSIFGPNTPPSPTLIDDLWQLLLLHDGRRVIPSVLRYIDERAVFAQRWQDALVNSKIPLAFINGIHDPISGQHMLDEFIRLLPNAKTFAFDVGHYPQIEAPEAVTKALLECWT
ncbi:MAG: alpha/beta hydrolase [Glaciecola sp.]|jgi:pimeloyl-ACP methyl ester carboxylesterase